MDQNYSTSITVDQSPEEVFAAINNVRGWWSENIDGDTDKLDALFYYHTEDIHRATMKITELVAGKKVVWHVLQNYFNFVQDTTEWTGTDIVFEISKQGDKTELLFTHVGLKPSDECYDICFDAWGTYIKHSLFDLITTGTGDPTLKGQQDRSAQIKALNDLPNAAS